MHKIIEEDIDTIVFSNCIDWSVFRNKTILITGATGMLPSYMVFTLLQLNRLWNFNISIVALVRNKDKAIRLFSDFSHDENLKYIVQDVSDPIDYDSKLDYIIHGASQASPKYYGLDPVGTAKANVIGTCNLLELAVQKKVEGFLFFSSSGIYGKYDSDDVIIKESNIGSVNPLNVNSCYFESKRMGENLCIDYHYQYGVPTKIVRIFHTLGPNMNLDDGRVFSDFCKSIVNNCDIVLKSDGEARRTFCYITDAIIAYFLVLIKGKNGDAYNVGSRVQETTMKDLANSLVNIFPEKNLKVQFEIDSNSITYTKMKNPVNRIIPDITKIQNLGWTEHTKCLDGFKRVILANEPK